MMKENQNMCIYCKFSENDPGWYYCESPGCTTPGAMKQAGDFNATFKIRCRRADENGWQCECDFFIKPKNTADVLLTATKNETAAGRSRAKERLTYLSQMETDRRRNVPSAKAQQDSGLIGGILKAGAKAAIDVGKAAVNSSGAATDFAADVAKNIIDEL